MSKALIWASSRSPLEIAGEDEEIGKAERIREFAHGIERRPGADDDRAKVAKPLGVDEFSDRPHEMIDAVLLGDHAEIAENEFARPPQSRLGLDAMDALSVGRPVDDLDRIRATCRRGARRCP